MKLKVKKIAIYSVAALSGLGVLVFSYMLLAFYHFINYELDGVVNLLESLSLSGYDNQQIDNILGSSAELIPFIQDNYIYGYITLSVLIVVSLIVLGIMIRMIIKLNRRKC